MRWIFRLLMIVVVLVIGAVGLVFLLPADKIGDIASAQLEKATGRKLTLSGEFKPTIYPVLGVKTGPLTISNADWANEPNMISAQGASVGVGLSALLGGDLEVKRLILDEPIIHLERRADGLANWELGGSASSGDTSSGGTSSESSSGGAFSLDKGAITNGQLTFTDGTTQKYHVIQEINVDFALPKSGAAAVKGASVWNGQVVDVDMSVTDLAALTGGQMTEVKGSAEMAGLGASLDGQLALKEDGLPLMNGSYTFEFLEPSIIAEMTRLTIPDALKGANEILSNGSIDISETGIVFGGDASMMMNGKPITANFDLKGPENWAETLRVELGLKVASKDAFTFAWSGLVNGTTGNADGTIDFNASNLPNTLALAGQAVGFPKGTGQTARVKGTVRVRDGKNQLRNAVIALDQNTFNGNAEMFFDRRPYISANLTAGALDFSAFISDEGGSGSNGSSGGASSSSSGSGWSKDPIRITGLDAINADIALKAKSVNLGVSELGKTDINAKLRNGALALTLNDVRAYQGALAGTVNFSGGDAVKFSSNIRANGVQLEPLLGRLLDIKRLTGSGNTTLKMSGTGGSLYQIMHSLSGNGSVRVDKGSFKGIDLAAMMKNLKQAFGGFEGATEFTSLTGTFTMKNGVLQNVDMSLVSPLFKAEGKGQINVGDQNMSYTVTPSSLSEDAKFSVPVEITGPWSNLSFKPDLGGLVDLLTKGRLEQEKLNLKAREDELKAEAKAKLLEKLNLQKAQDEAAAQQSTEDAVKQSAEDKLKQEVGNALKGLFQ
ncbi:AsmA family protein [Amylibacter sp. SFDW26]|uniref:AsmA family protein n=1 Tax=Amylibacter sp. SFDW26 TaxID=2652722 RepID=UPI001869B0A7|nr:AsmA family protein [Amylibacter sp. SFDW26]